MVAVNYEYQFGYPSDLRGRRFPRLTLRMTSPRDSELSLDVDAYLDSGAERSLFDGSIARALGVDLLRGETITYASTAGVGLHAVLHKVHLHHEDLGRFNLEVVFSTVPISRNLLGRDFFDHVQIGFREHHSSFLITATP